MAGGQTQAAEQGQAGCNCVQFFAHRIKTNP
jgi:hypothetical protein